jgi:hypothetical protein
MHGCARQVSRSSSDSSGRPSLARLIPGTIAALVVAAVLGMAPGLGPIGLGAGTAHAQRGPEKVFAGKVLLSAKRFPLQAKSANAYVSALRKQAKTTFLEDREKKEWKIHFAAFFKAPLDDLEVIIKIYDITGGGQALLSSFEQFTDQRGQRTLISSMRLERKQFGVNKHLLITVETRGRVLASGRFKIVGEADRYSGKVDFSEDDAKKGEGED